MGPSNPWRLEPRPKGHNQQRAETWYCVDHMIKQFEARGIGPLRILKYHQPSVHSCQRLDLLSERLQRSISTLLRGQVELRVSPVVPKQQQIGEEPGILDRSRCLCQQRVELVELRSHGVIVGEPRRTFHLADTRVKCAVCMLWGAENAQPRVRLAGKTFE